MRCSTYHKFVNTAQSPTAYNLNYCTKQCFQFQQQRDICAAYTIGALCVARCYGEEVWSHVYNCALGAWQRNKVKKEDLLQEDVQVDPVLGDFAEWHYTQKHRRECECLI